MFYTNCQHTVKIYLSTKYLTFDKWCLDMKMVRLKTVWNYGTEMERYWLKNYLFSQYNDFLFRDWDGMTHHVVLNHILSVRSRFLLNTTHCQPFKDCTLYNDYSSLRNASHTTVVLNHFSIYETSPKVWHQFLASQYVPFKNS